MEEYVSPLLDVQFFDVRSDIITESNANDNNYSDIDWGDMDF